MVTDSTGQETVRRIFIELSDINDNLPSFDCPGSPKVDPIVAYVMENVNNTKVVQVQACDADSDSEIFYHIIGELKMYSETYGGVAIHADES